MIGTLLIGLATALVLSSRDKKLKLGTGLRTWLTQEFRYPRFSVHSSDNPTTVTNHTVNVGSPVAGQLLIVIFRCTQNAPTVTFPAGWNQLDQSSADGSADTMAVFWRRADGTEGASITVTTSAIARSVALCFKITGGADPYYAYYTRTNGTISGTMAFDRIDGPTTPDYNLFIAFATWETNATVSANPGSDWINVGEFRNTGSSGAGIATITAAYVYSYHARRGPGSFSISSAQWGMNGGLLIRPG